MNSIVGRSNGRGEREDDRRRPDGGRVQEARPQNDRPFPSNQTAKFKQHQNSRQKRSDMQRGYSSIYRPKHFNLLEKSSTLVF